MIDRQVVIQTLLETPDEEDEAPFSSIPRQIQGRIIDENENIVTVKIGCLLFYFSYPTGDQLLSRVKGGAFPLRRPNCRIVDWGID